MIDEQNLEKKFLSLTNSQESIQTLSLWALHHRNNYKKIIQVWFKILEKDKISHRLTLFYLANDVIQHAKKKGYKQYLDGFKEVLKKATVLVRDDKISAKIGRIFTIWIERNIYSDEFMKELKQILGDSNDKITPSKSKESSYSQSSRVPTDFSLHNLEKRIRETESVDKSTKVLLSSVNTHKIDKIDSHILSHLKDKKAGEQCCKELNEIENQLKNAIHSLEKQVHCRSSLMDAFEKCELFYETQKSEVKIVANAYKNFSTRVKAVKNKLSSNTTTFPSPYPSPVIDAPSPNSDDDLILPGNDSPLPGLKSLLNVLNENSAKNNKISSLDKRLSNLMQNLPSINEMQNNLHKDKQQKDKKQQDLSFNSDNSWSANVQIPQISNALVNPLVQVNQNHQINSPLLNQPIIPQQSINQQQQLTHHHMKPVHSLLPPLIPQAPQLATPMNRMIRDQNYLPANYPPPRIPLTNEYDYYGNQNKSNANPNEYMTHPIQNQNLYSNNITASNSVHQIKSVVSSRNEQHQELIDPNIPYDPYHSVGSMSNTMDSFEPTDMVIDMDLGNSDDEEMNRSSNSNRVLKVIETSDDSNYNGSSNNIYNKKSNTNFSSTSVNYTPHLKPPIVNIPPPSLPPQLPNLALTNNQYASNSSSLTSLSSNAITPLINVQHSTNQHYHNGKSQINHQNNRSNKKFHHDNNRSPRWSNSNYQLIDTTSPNFNQQQSSTANQYSSNNRNRNWKGTRNYQNNNQQQHHQNRNRSFNKNLNSSTSNYNFATTNNNTVNITTNSTATFSFNPQTQ